MCSFRRYTAGLLQDEDTVRWLSLSDCGVGPEDLTVIGLLLQGNECATALDLSLNLVAGEKGEVN